MVFALIVCINTVAWGPTAKIFPAVTINRCVYEKTEWPIDKIVTGATKTHETRP